MSRKKLIVSELGLLFEASSDDTDTLAVRETPVTHSLQSSRGLLQHTHGFVLAADPQFPSGKKRVYFPDAGDTPDVLLRNTQWFIFIGALLSPELLRLAGKALIFVFEPSRERMDVFIEQLDLPVLARKNIVFFSGDPDTLEEPLLHLLPVSATELGVPVFFARSDIPKRFVERVRRVIEIFYYHYQVYPFEDFIPFADGRFVAGGYSFPQSRHLLENLGFLADEEKTGTVDALRNVCPGSTALLVAAGPALLEQMDVVRRLAPSCIVICAGKVYSILLRHGIRPDVTVLMDARDASAAELAEGVPSTGVLVSYILAGAAATSFPYVFFYGHELEQLGLAANMIDHLGSVMNYAFFLACHMGCTRIICAGLQLASRVRAGEGYAAGTAPVSATTQVWSCPVFLPGQVDPVYTILNFLDVALHMQARIQKMGIPVLNLTQDSLVHGKGIVYDPDPQVAWQAPRRPLGLSIAPRPVETRIRIREALRSAAGRWKILSAPDTLLVSDPSGTIPLADRFSPLLRKLDADGTTHLMKSFPGYHAASFPPAFFGSDTQKRDAAAANMIRYLGEASRILRSAAEEALARWSEAERKCGQA